MNEGEMVIRFTQEGKVLLGIRIKIGNESFYVPFFIFESRECLREAGLKFIEIADDKKILSTEERQISNDILRKALGNNNDK